MLDVSGMKVDPVLCRKGASQRVLCTAFGLAFEVLEGFLEGIEKPGLGILERSKAQGRRRGRESRVLKVGRELPRESHQPDGLGLLGREQERHLAVAGRKFEYAAEVFEDVLGGH